jgi:hypothetical protein
MTKAHATSASKTMKRKTTNSRFVDDYSVGFGEVAGGPVDGLRACGIIFRNIDAKKKVKFAMPKEMAIQLAKDILELTEEEDDES